MWIVRTDSPLRVFCPHGKPGGPLVVNGVTARFTDPHQWRNYRTRDDKWYDNEEVYDLVRLANGHDMPPWVRTAIEREGYAVIAKDGYYAKCLPQHMQYID